MEFVSTTAHRRRSGPTARHLADDVVYTAGQIALDPATGDIVAGGVTEQTERVFANLRAILEAAGTGLASVVKTTVYLTDMNDFKAMNDIYARAFGDHRPARSTVAVAALPRGVRVEIDVIARRGR
jgi:endoribonuclease L-PSP, putative